MGWTCSWIAVRGKTQCAVLAALGLEGTGKRDAMPDAPWTISALSGGHLMVFCSDDCAPARFADAVLASISAEGELLHSCVEEHVMMSSAAYWRNGEKRWSVSHDAQNGRYDLQVSGRAPASFEAIRQSTFLRQDAEGGDGAGVDLVFDIPLQLGAALTGFRHDEFPDDVEDAYEALAGIAMASVDPTGNKPWWRRW